MGLTGSSTIFGCRLPASFREFLKMTGGSGLRPLYVSTAAINGDGGSVIGDTNAAMDRPGVTLSGDLNAGRRGAGH
jgi:hypothetical protein